VVLARTIETEILPRLMMLNLDGVPQTPHQGEAFEQDPSGGLEARGDGDVELAGFMEALLSASQQEVIDAVEARLLAGVAFPRIILDWLAPAATRLGELWDEDRLSFVEVSIAMTRLHRLIRHFRPPAEVVFSNAAPRSLLLATAPGETHTFGLSIIETFFLKDGWEVACETRPDPEALIDRVARDWFDVVGIAASCDASVARLPALVIRLREMACNRDIRILLGGRPFTDSPQRVMGLGADLPAYGPTELVLRVNAMMAELRDAQV
jgi:methanogenic corrinoid protein MtbC1